MVTKLLGKIEAIYPYDILLNEGVENAIRSNTPEGGLVIIYPPAKKRDMTIQNGRYLSKMRADIILDIDSKPIDKTIDQYFIQVFIESAHPFLEEVWFYTKLAGVDPYIHPQYLKIEYFYENGSPFTNPETGRNSYEENQPSGIILDRTDWEHICSNLSEGKKRDISESWLCNAITMQNMRRWDVVILLCAIACEFKVKRLCSLLVRQEEIPSELWETIVLDIRPRVMTYYENILPRISNNTMKLPNSLNKRLKILFAHRNKIAHTGLITSILADDQTADAIIQITKDHIKTTQDIIGWIDSKIASLNTDES